MPLRISRGRCGTTLCARRCLNEPDVLAAVQARTNVSMRMVDLSELAFVEQLKLFRQADVLTGIHGAAIASSD